MPLTGALGHVDGGIGLPHQDQGDPLPSSLNRLIPHRGAVQLVIADVEGVAEDRHQLPGEVLRQDLGVT